MLATFVVVFGAVTLALRMDRKGQTQTLDMVLNEPVPATMVQAPATLPGMVDFREAARRVMPTVVSIDTAVEVEDWVGNRESQPVGQGSGVVITTDGYIVTNNHVITVPTRGGQSRVADVVQVTFSDGQSMAARVIGTDPFSDIAFLKVEATNLQAIEMGDSDRLEVGQWVMAIGNPLGYENTLSVGVVSSVGRALPTGGTSVLVDAIQTDAAINQGNSGGALTDASGRLIGINSAIASTNGGSIGIGFSIPINHVKRVVDDLRRYGRARYAGIGVTFDSRTWILGTQRGRSALQEYLEITAQAPTYGLLISAVGPSSPAREAGLRPFDVIQSVDGKQVRTMLDYLQLTNRKRPGDTAQIGLWSRGETRTVTVTLTDVARN